MIFNFAGCVESTTIIKETAPCKERGKTKDGRLYFQYQYKNDWYLAIQITESIDDSPYWFALFQCSENKRLSVNDELTSFVQNIVDLYRSKFGIEFGKYSSVEEQHMRNSIVNISSLPNADNHIETMEIKKNSVLSLREDSSEFYYVCMGDTILHKYSSRQWAEKEYDYISRDIEYFVKNRWKL